ncbi:SH3 domain-containing protein [Longispora albida]|uniref:SH3 domain-containing protein n=1 Tax=Longispora albida TaxID=203523 RepID=UPI00316AD99A
MAAPAHASEGSPFQSRVYATREGLVGKTTANGHVITERDHFVALPSRRGLSSKGGGEYTVKVCTEDGARCEYAPVWDVGPWNTHDDYWNELREWWCDLPRGLPMAQAAIEGGYNRGKDEFGRTVSNPAGIDLADGTFWDGLGLTSNAWIIATFLWTSGSPASGKVAVESGLLNVRSGPGTGYRIVAVAASAAVLPLDCQTGDWYRLSDGNYVHSGYVTSEGTAPDC